MTSQMSWNSIGYAIQSNYKSEDSYVEGCSMLALGNFLGPSNFTPKVYWIQLSLGIRDQASQLNGGIYCFQNHRIAFTTASLCNSCFKACSMYFQFIIGTLQIPSYLYSQVSSWWKL